MNKKEKAGIKPAYICNLVIFRGGDSNPRIPKDRLLFRQVL